MPTSKTDKTSSLAAKRDRVVEIVKRDGPLLPIAIAKRLELDTTFSAAILSELVDNKLLMITNVKYGGSPFYYAPGQESKLKDLIKHLNEKDRETAQLLMEKKILRDRDLNTLYRFSLRQIKDFAKSVRIIMNNETDMFWKWHLVNDDEVKKLINDYFESKLPKTEDKKTAGKTKEKLKEKPLDEFKKDVQEIEEEIHETETEDEIEEEKIEEVGTKPKEQEKIKQPAKAKITRITKITKQDIEIEKPAYDRLGMFFSDTQVDIMDQKIIRKKKEINYIAGVNTDLGKGIFFLKYKDKGKINEADISLAMHEAGKLPLIFLSTGELTSKARELLGMEFKGVIFRKI